jgi:hypothetical protein
MVTATEAKDAAREAEDSEPVDKMARFGLASRGVIWLVMGLLALAVAVGERAKADKVGAFEAIRERPLGGTLLVLLALGFTGYALWRLLQGTVGHRDSSKDVTKWVKRAMSIGRGLLYAGFAFSTVKFLVTDHGKDEVKPLTARAMAEPGGRTLVMVVGVGMIITGLYMAVRGVLAKFEKKLKPIPEGLRTLVRVIATIGLVGRGLVFVLIGWFVARAAWTFEPEKAKGLDASLKTVAQQPYGQGLLFATALSLICFALWSFAEARWRRI